MRKMSGARRFRKRLLLNPGTDAHCISAKVEMARRSASHWIGQVLRTFQYTYPREVVFVFVAWIITMVVHALYKLGEMAHSRGREYLADVGAVALTGWENRAKLITALLKIGHGQGFGVGNTHGAAGYPSGESYKLGATYPYTRIPPEQTRRPCVGTIEPDVLKTSETSR